MQHFSQELRSLNPEQLQAVQHIDGPLLVLAGAGSGKTRVATLRIANLIASGVQASSILGLTFTNKAAQEMKERVQKHVNQTIVVSTFHSLGARLLRESIEHLGYTKDFVIYDEDDSEKLLKESAKELGIAAQLDLKAARAFISSTKNKLGYDPQEGFSQLYDRYNEKLKACNALDFDDLLRLPVELFSDFPEVLAYYQDRWHYILVDEYQDTNMAQYSFIKLLCGERCNLFVVGDPDQSIYSWRGANVQNILNFEKDFPGAKVVRLEQNYRSTNTILQAANAVIQRNAGRYEKNLWSGLGEGEKIGIFAARSEREEARFVGQHIAEFSMKKGVKLSQMCLFYRTNFLSRVLEDELLSRRIPYVVIGGISYYLRKEIKDILSFLRLLENPQDVISFMRVINLPKRGFGDTTLEKLLQAQAASNMPILDFMLQVYHDNAFSKLPFTVTAKQKEGWAEFAKIFVALKKTKESESLEELVRTAILGTRYMDVLNEDSETRQEKLENVEELIVKAAEWEASQDQPTLANFLQETSLVSSLDTQDKDQDAVNLMTVHNGKGLEFEISFLIGLEEDLFPHINCKKTPEQVEEERRLFYVGMTRAKRHLFISCSQMRSLWGSTRRMRPSRFLQEIPQMHRKILSFSPPPPAFEPRSESESESSIVHHQAPKETRIFDVGELVFHPQFGVGKIENVHDGSLGVMYEIFFTKDESTKKLVAKFAPLSSLAAK